MSPRRASKDARAATPMKPSATRLTMALWGSLAVYLIPLVGPHAVWFLGESLAQEFGRTGEREPWWLAANLTLALAAQAAVGLMLAWSLRGSRLRLLAWVPVIPLLVAGVNLAYLVAIPSYFLIEPDTAPEVAGWEQRCLVPDVSLMPVRTPVNQPRGGAREWWVQRSDAQYGLLRVPACVVVDAGLPLPAVQPDGRVDVMLAFQFAAPGGSAIVERLVPRTSERSWWLLDGPSSPLVPIEPPDPVSGPPILSDTADALAWVQRVSGSSPPILERVVIRARQPGREGAVDIELAPFGPASYSLLGIDTVEREAILWRNTEPLVVGFDGKNRGTPFTPGAVRAQPTTYLRHRDGWVAWDAYREQGAYQLSWSLAGGSGTRRANKGRSITSAAVDPSGQLIAMSESTTLSIGRARDVVYVFRARDQAELFRLYLPRYARSQVVFFEGGFFGYSDLDGTHILAMPQ